MNNLKSVFLALWLVMGVTVNSVAQSAADLYKRANQQYVLFESERDKGTNVNGMYDYLIDSYGKFVDVTKASGNAQYLDGTKNRLGNVSLSVECSIVLLRPETAGKSSGFCRCIY